MICNAVGPDACPLSHPGELALDCFRGVPAAPDSHMGVAPQFFSTGDAVPYSGNPFEGVKLSGGWIRMPEEEKQEQVEEEDMFEEAPAPTPPKKDIVVEPNDDDAVADAWFEQVIEEFDSANEYAFGLVCVKDDEGDVIVTLTIDNVNIDIRLEDFIELAKALRDALPKLKAIYMEQ